MSSDGGRVPPPAADAQPSTKAPKKKRPKKVNVCRNGQHVTATCRGRIFLGQKLNIDTESFTSKEMTEMEIDKIVEILKSRFLFDPAEENWKSDDALRYHSFRVRVNDIAIPGEALFFLPRLLEMTLDCGSQSIKMPDIDRFSLEMLLKCIASARLVGSAMSKYVSLLPWNYRRKHPYTKRDPKFLKLFDDHVTDLFPDVDALRSTYDMIVKFGGARIWFIFWLIVYSRPEIFNKSFMGFAFDSPFRKKIDNPSREEIQAMAHTHMNVDYELLKKDVVWLWDMVQSSDKQNEQKMINRAIEREKIRKQLMRIHVSYTTPPAQGPCITPNGYQPFRPA